MTIDWWTLGFQTVNVLILMALLQHFFWRPIAAMIAKRQTAIDTALADAKATQAKAEAGLATIAVTRAGFAKEHDAILKDAHQEAEQARAKTLDEAAKDVAARETVATMGIAKERSDAEQAWSDRASQLAVTIAGRLAARLQGPAVSAAFLDWMLASIRALPDAVLKATEGTKLDAVSAAALPADEQEHVRALIGQALGTQAQINFTTDPSLIAGLELQGAHVMVANSWRADLGTILAELKQHAA
jgi:F-type H+-transporting ATPase subunit b